MRDQQKAQVTTKGAALLERQLQAQAEMQRITDRLQEPLGRDDRKFLETRKKEIGAQIREANARRAEFERELLDLEISPYDRARAYSYSAERQRRSCPAHEDAMRFLWQPIREPSIDHVVSIDAMTQMDGWNELTLDEQRALLNNTDNLRLMEKRFNFSKNNKSWSKWAAGRRFYPEAWSKMAELESTLKRDIANKIHDTLADRGKRAQRPDRQVH